MLDLKGIKYIHMIGIGGISMSGIAHILKAWGYKVTGSDCSNSSIIDDLNKNEIKVNVPHNEKVINKNIDVVVYTAAIKDDNKELIKAKELNIPVIERGKFLGEITKLFKDTIGISGTHGKTTTTSMISECFIEANMDPNILVGSILNSINSNYKLGNSNYFIIEACEFSDSFLNFKQKSAIILNIDDDHLDYFKTFDNIVKSFKKYVNNLPNYGLLVINGDDKNCIEVSKYSKAKVITFGLSDNNMYSAKNIKFDNFGNPSYDLYINKKYVDKIELSVIGIHNVLNSLACIALCDNYNLNMKSIKKGLINYKGAKRRFEFKGKLNEAYVYDDYGHHPTEIEALYKAISNMNFNKSWVLFEPHTYSRLKEHIEEFARALSNFDNIIITDIYAAREKNIYNINPMDLINKINKKAIYMNNYNDIKKYLLKSINNNDLIITLGAGNITKLSDLLTKKTRKKF